MTRSASTALPLPVRRAPYWMDAVLAVLAAVLSVAVVLSADTAAIDPELRPATWGVAAVTAVGAAGVGWRRRAPLIGLGLVAGAATVVSLSSHFTGLLPYLTIMALYAVAAHGTRGQAVGGLVLVAVVVAALRLTGVPDLAVVDVATNVGFCVAAVAVGDAVRQRRAHQLDLLVAAEARTEVASQRAVAEERLRIARELHDVVAHSMSLIAVQAGVGAHLLRRDPGAAEQALAVIAETSRTALTQTRSVVGLLRSGDDAQTSLAGLGSRRRIPGSRASGSSACRSGPARWAGRWTPDRPRTAASGSWPCCPPAAARDPGGSGRRPGAGAQRLRHAAALRPGHRRRGGGRQRARRRRAGPVDPAGRRPDGRADARHGRVGGHPADRRRRALRRLRAGASGFLLKDVRPQHLLDAIEVVAGGEALLAPTVTRRLIELFATLPAPRTMDAAVTDRERDVLQCIARGLSNVEVGEELHLAYGTVKTHVSSLLLKLGCRDRAQLVMVAYETGVVVPGAPA